MQLTLALGTNLGDRPANLRRARQRLTELIGPLVAQTTVAETPAWGVSDQPAFLNQVIVLQAKGETAGAGLTGEALVVRLHHWLNICQRVEAEGGRERKQHWGPRTIDVDIVFAGDILYEDDRLQLPHPWWKNRDFVGGIIARELADLFPQYYGPRPRIEEVLPSPKPFLQKLFAAIPPALHHLAVDHICYRVDTPKAYALLRDHLLAAGHELLAESLIGGRSIATFRLLTPVRFAGQSIRLLELPAPKAGSPYPAGYEHAEMVTDRPLPEFEGWLLKQTHYTAKDLDRSGRRKSLNADLRVRLADGLSIKFHEQSLDEVIRIERAS